MMAERCDPFARPLCIEQMLANVTQPDGPKAHARFKQRVKEITRRNRGHNVQDVIDELRRAPI